MAGDTNHPVLQWLEQQRPAMTDLLEKVVNIDSGSYNKAGVDAVGREFEAFFEGEGIPTDRGSARRFRRLHSRLRFRR